MALFVMDHQSQQYKVNSTKIWHKLKFVAKHSSNRSCFCMLCGKRLVICWFVHHFCLHSTTHISRWIATVDPGRVILTIPTMDSDTPHTANQHKSIYRAMAPVATSNSDTLPHQYPLPSSPRWQTCPLEPAIK
jgi:hypothetical protein